MSNFIDESEGSGSNFYSLSCKNDGEYLDLEDQEVFNNLKNLIMTHNPVFKVKRSQKEKRRYIQVDWVPKS